MIYIDPPYNTGKDFVYKDNYADNLGNYLAITGQTDAEGRKLSTNTESDGRYHSNWLDMMYPRLKLARNLLKEDGVIFISIDDNEVQNLRKLCDEVFGEGNFIASIIWQKKYSPQNDATYFSVMHDYILCFAKTKKQAKTDKYGFSLNLLERTNVQNARYSNPDNDRRGDWKSADMSVKTYSKDYDYSVTTPNGRVVNPPKGRSWVFGPDKFNEMVKDSRIWFGNDGNSVPSIKKFLTEVKQGIVPSTLWFREDVGDNQDAAKELKELFEYPPFGTPKPTSLIKRILELSTNSKTDDIIIDFFAGSGTTAHASMQLNAEDEGNRKFVGVQLPELTETESEAYKAGYRTIAEITKERIRRAGEKIKSEFKEDLFSRDSKSLDIGFRVFKLDSSNISAWDGNVQKFEQNLLSVSENIKPDRTEEDVLYEILLKSGLDLAQPIEERIISGKKVFNIGIGALFICLADKLTTAVAEGIGKWKKELEPATCRVIFKDTGFNDVEKTNSIQILKHYGIGEVNSI
jgi:adenine-specific DNA-methyltransferase